MANIIVFEGTDGAGKGTQARLLQDALGKTARMFEMSFPDYDGFFGREIGGLLSGRQAVSAKDLDPRSMALWFAVERMHRFKAVVLADYDFVILNRYVLSNVVYQSLRVEPGQRAGFAQWVQELEYEQFGLPRPTLTFVLDADLGLTAGNVARKGYRDYTGLEPDVYERSSTTQRLARQLYKEAALNLPGGVLVSCADGTGRMRCANDIAAEVLAAVREKFGCGIG